MFTVAPLALSDMVAMSAALRNAGTNARSMEDAAQDVVSYLLESLCGADGDRACALVRFYKTQRFEELPPELQAAALAASGETPTDPGVSCLTLLATAGAEKDWNDRHRSLNHRAIPLHSSAAIAQLPMVHALVRQLGVDPALLAEPRADLFTAMDERSYNVFHVPEALGSPFVPAQEDFVQRFGIRSVLGCGGVLPSGEFFATVLFTTVPVPRETAEAFSSLALSIKLAILPFVDGPFFTTTPGSTTVPADGPARAPDDRQRRSRAAALSQLLEVREESIRDQAARLEAALVAAEARTAELAESQALLLASEARNRAVVRSSIDAIISIDHLGHIIEFNPAAEKIFGWTHDEIIGVAVQEALIPVRFRERHARGLEEYMHTGHGPILGRHIELVARRADGSEFPVELTVTAVEIEDAPPIFTAYIRDISARKESEQARLAAQRHTAHIARTLQDSLLPPVLPQIPGTQVAARYVPAGAGSQIGGDFYDVFETGRNDWAVVLGDVCGKGAEAATVTALARYTTRAAAMRARRPSKVLSVLNEAVLSQYPERFLTAAYVRLRVAGAALQGTASLGGHPPPLLLAPDGTVTPIGQPALMVGAFDGAKFSDVSFGLPSAHSLVLFTDGVTEARSGDNFFGDERLREVLSDQGGQSATSVVDAIVRAVRDFEGSEPADDMAILVVRAD